MTDSRLFFTGNTLDQAVLAGASHYGLEASELAYDRVERRTGFLRGRKRVVIRVDSSKPKRAADSPPANAEAVVADHSSDADDLQQEVVSAAPVDDVGAEPEKQVETQAAEPQEEIHQDAETETVEILEGSRMNR